MSNEINWRRDARCYGDNRWDQDRLQVSDGRGGLRKESVGDHKERLEWAELQCWSCRAREACRQLPTADGASGMVTGQLVRYDGESDATQEDAA